MQVVVHQAIGHYLDAPLADLAGQLPQVHLPVFVLPKDDAAFVAPTHDVVVAAAGFLPGLSWHDNTPLPLIRAHDTILGGGPQEPSPRSS